MKPIFYLLTSLLFLSCNSQETNKNTWKIEDLTNEEITFMKEIYQQEKEWEEYESKKKSLLGLADFQNIELLDDQFGYQLTIFNPKKYQEIVEVVESQQYDVIDYKTIRFKLDHDCHYIFGDKKLTNDCIEIIKSTSGQIDRITMDSLNKLVLNNDFWEFTKEESEIRGTGMYHGEVWSLEGAYAKDYRKNEYSDTTVVRTHMVSRRIFNEDFKAFKEIGNHIKKITSMEVTD